jgi:hypothetical protein
MVREVTARTEHDSLFDRIAVQDVICAVTLYSDLDEPDKALAQYTDDAIIDYSSVMGPDSARVPVKVHRQRLAEFLPGFDARQHQVTNFEVTFEGDTAVVRSQCRAAHCLGKEFWIAGATYHHRLVRSSAGWKITYQRAHLLFQEGEHLVSLARARVTAKQ